jgi:hypothetical protein
MPHLNDSPPGHLSVSRAFVVQFDTHADVPRGQLTGRVEHVVSGQATPFRSLEALLVFMAQVLQAESRAARSGET